MRIRVSAVLTLKITYHSIIDYLKIRKWQQMLQSLNFRT